MGDTVDEAPTIRIGDRISHDAGPYWVGREVSTFGTVLGFNQRNGYVIADFDYGGVVYAPATALEILKKVE